MSEPLTRDQPMRNALLHRRFDADERPAPSRPRPRRGRGGPEVATDLAPTTETPVAEPEVVEEGPQLMLSEVVADALAWVQSGWPAETPVLGITSTGATVAIAGLVLDPPIAGDPS